MDVNPQDEQLSNLHGDLSSREGYRASERELSGERVREGDGCGEEIFEEGGLDGLGQRMRDGELGHVIFLVAQADEVVVDARLVFARVVEVEVFGLHVVRAELLGFEFGDFFQEALLLVEGHAPDDDSAVFEEEDFGGVYFGVKVEGVGRGRVWGLEGAEVAVDVVGGRAFAGLERGVSGFGVQVYELFTGLLPVRFNFDGAVREAALAV